MAMESPWKHVRDDVALARQWGKRLDGPLPFILEEVQNRMISRASIIRPPEGPVVMHGWLHRDSVMPVLDLFPKRSLQVISHSDVFQAKRESVQPRLGLLKSLMPSSFSVAKPAYETVVCAPGEKLPLADSSAAMVWSPLWVQSVQDPAFLFDEWFRVLSLQGGVFFSTLGPDTATLLKNIAYELELPFPDFMDMHDLGDLMARQGFSDPVVEMEKLSLSYFDVAKLLKEWRALFGNNLQGRGAALHGKSLLPKLLKRLEQLRQGPENRVFLELELVYGHAWKVQPKTVPGEAFIPVSSIKRAPKN